MSHSTTNLLTIDTSIKEKQEPGTILCLFTILPIQYSFICKIVNNQRIVCDRIPGLKFKITYLDQKLRFDEIRQDKQQSTRKYF